MGKVKKKFITEGDVNASSFREQWNKNISDAKTRDILERDNNSFLHQSLSTPCLDVIESCEGIYIINNTGKKYMDFHGNNVHQVGYGNEFVKEAVKKQMDTIPFCPRRYTNEKAVQLAEKLGALSPGNLNRVLLMPGGTTAVSTALKLARVVTGKHKIVTCWDSFHGASMDAISVGGEAQFRSYMGPLMPGVERIPPPSSYRSTFRNNGNDDLFSAEYLEYVIEKEGDIGAFIAETIRNTDVQVPSKAYWKKVREICTKHGVLLILDEIPIAFGRTGKMFAYEHYDIEPDIVCLGKGLGAGIIPIAAIVARDDFNIADDVALGHYTHEKGTLGSAAALAMLQFIEDNNLLAKVKEDEQFMRDQLTILKDKYSLIGDIRGIGLLWGIELVKDRDTKEKAIRESEAVMYECLNRGLSFKVSAGNVLQLSPPLIITREQLKEALAIVEGAIASVS
ncbi:MAG: aspartate aminotransferase family protein [Bacteroidota bacterium]